MASVTARINEIKQPRGGYINPTSLTVVSYKDGIVLNEHENINPTNIGMVVDYLTRYCINDNAKKSFQISLLGASLVGELDKAMEMLHKVETCGSGESIINACKLTGYDVCLRAGRQYFKSVDTINPDYSTIENILRMLERSVNFLGTNKPILSDGFTFPGGYTDIIDSGDGDYITKDALWDFKVSKNNPNNKQTLQVLIYYLMGIHSTDIVFNNIERIGIYNPRLNTEYFINIKDIPAEVIDSVNKYVIGYKTA